MTGLTKIFWPKKREVFYIDINNGINLPVIFQWFEYHNLINMQDYQPRITHDPVSDVELMADTYQIGCQIFPSKAVLDTTNLFLIWTIDTAFADSSHLWADSTDDVFRAEIPTVTEPSSIKYYF